MIHNDSVDVIDKWAVPQRDRASVAQIIKTPIFRSVFPSALAAPYYRTRKLRRRRLVRDLIVCCDGARQTASATATPSASGAS